MSRPFPEWSPHMIRHCVFIRFRGDITEGEGAELLQEVADLQQHLSGIIAVHVGSNVSPETGMDKGFGNGFIVDFDSAEARDRYLADEGHRRVGARLVAAADGGTDGIFVYDLEL